MVEIMKKIIFCFLFLFILCSHNLGSCSNPAIVAVVGEEVITSKDLSDRYKFFLVENPNIKVSDQDQKLILYKNILKSMIDETILYQELDKLNIKISKSDIDQAVELIEKKQKIKPGNFYEYVSKSGLSKEYAISQIKKNILWDRFIEEVVSPQIQVSNNEILEYISGAHPDMLWVDYMIFNSSQAKLEHVTEKLSSCDSLGSLGKINFKRQKQKLSEIKDKNLKRAIISTYERHPSYIFKTEDGDELVFVCEKIKPQDHRFINEILGKIRQQKIALQAEYKIKNLAKNKHIEIFNFDV